MTGRCPRLVIAGTGSGVGKTSLTLGIVAALVRSGLRVQTFKVGPDFLDPTYLTIASGRPCYNLDGWMTHRGYVRQLFVEATADADIAIIEGVMGMFDGASPTSLEGSTAEIAAWIEAPVLLVVNAHGTARSLAAAVAGFAHFESSVDVAGVIANHAGSARHRAWLSESLSAAKLPPLVGAMPRDALPALPSRHLGLVTADRQLFSREKIVELASACEKHVDLKQIVAMAQSAGPIVTAVPPVRPNGRAVRVGIASDAAFHFYYADNLEMLQSRGVHLVTFSPLKDGNLPANLDAVYIGGGYPEVHASELSANGSMLDSIREFAASGKPLYAECGGLIYLGRSVQSAEGAKMPLAGVLPIETRMGERLRTLGYVEATLTADSLFGSAGQTLRGHEFHYSHIVADDAERDGWRRIYSLRRRHGRQPEAEGYQKGRILASYVHLHFASRPEVLDCFINRCEEEA